MCFSTPKVPKAEAPPRREMEDPAITAALDNDRRLRASRSGLRSTILTGPGGTAAPQTAVKTLLGS